jgi:hypothetical protein
VAGYDFEFYETGTISVTAGQKAFTGTGTAWKLRGCEGALVVVVGAGTVNFVSSLSTDAAGEFRTEWAGPDLVDASYVMWLPSAVAATALANHQRLAEIIAGIQGAQPESAILSAFAALQGSDGKLPMFTGENTLELVKYIADAKGSLAKLAALQLAANTVLRTNADGAIEQSQLTSSGVALLKAPPVVDGQFLYAIGPNDFSVATITTWSRSFLASPDAAEQRRIIGYNRPAFKAHLAANQLVYNGTTNLTFTAAPLNVNNGWSGGRFTITQPGTYFFMLNITIGDGFAGQFIPQIFVSNGTNPSSVYSEVVAPIGPQSAQRFYAGGNVGAAIWLNTGSYVEFKLVLDAVQGNPYMGAFRCSATGFLM